ncbi:MAG: MdtA/MuxA family multidrug efflux RND transporter periplasmic adaptor subunit [Bacteroidales bacterium]
MSTENKGEFDHSIVTVDRPAREDERPAAVEREPDPGARGADRPRWWLWALALVLVFLGVFIHAQGTKPTSSAQTTPGGGGATGRGRGSMMVPVTAVVARQGDMPVYLNGLGSVISLDTVTVHSRVDGQLMSVNFKEGQLVHKGEVLAQIDPRPFEVQLAQAEGQVAKDEASLKNAQLDVQRYQVLFAQDAVPRQTLDTAVATLNQFEGAVKSDQAAVASANLNLTYSRITAPVTGRIGLRLVDPGNMVHASDQNGLVVITERQPIGVLFTVSEDVLPQVLKQMRGSRPLVVEAWDRDLKARLATGRLLTIDNTIDQTTGTVRLKAQFGNEDETLFPNQFVNARLLLDSLKGVALVPAAAIQRNQQSTFVYVLTPDNTVQLRNVDVARTEGDTSAVQIGLAAGERVAVEGVDKLQQGMKVAVRMPGAGEGGRGGLTAGRPQ